MCIHRFKNAIVCKRKTEPKTCKILFQYFFLLEGQNIKMMTAYK